MGRKQRLKKYLLLEIKFIRIENLRSIIVSEEYKFWKFISGKKFLNEKSKIFR